MKTNELKKIHAQTQAELQRRIDEVEKELVGAKLERVSRQTTNVKAFKNLRQSLAQLKTILRAKQKTK